MHTPHKRRRVALLAAGVLLPLPVLAGCSSDDGDSRPPASAQDLPTAARDQLTGAGTVRWAVDAPPATFNVFQADADAGTERIAGAVLPALFTLDSRGRPERNEDYLKSAEVTEREPRQIVVYKLNPKAVWSDGRAVGVADFKAQWKALRGTDSAYWTARNAGYDRIAKVQPGDGDHEVKVTFAKPYADWRSLFTPLYPKKVMGSPNAFNDAARDGLPVAAGPFAVRERGRKTVTLVRNARWWGDRARVKRLVFTAVPRDERAAALAAGRLDLAEIDRATADRIGAAAEPRKKKKKSAAGAGAGAAGAEAGTEAGRGAREAAPAPRPAPPGPGEDAGAVASGLEGDAGTADSPVGGQDPAGGGMEGQDTGPGGAGLGDGLDDEPVEGAEGAEGPAGPEQGLEREQGRDIVDDADGEGAPGAPDNAGAPASPGSAGSGADIAEKAVAELAALRDLTVRKAFAPGYTQLALNGNRGPLADERVRRAVARAIDRSALASAVLKPLGLPARPLGNHLIMSGQQGYKDNSGALGRPDTQAAQALLADAGWRPDAAASERQKDLEARADSRLGPQPHGAPTGSGSTPPSEEPSADGSADGPAAGGAAAEGAGESGRETRTGGTPLRTKNGEPLVLRFVVPADAEAAPLRTVGDRIARMLDAIGVRTEITKVTGDSYFRDHVATGNFDLALYSWPATAYPATDARPIFAKPQPAADGSLVVEQNYARVGTDQIDQLFAQAASELDSGAARKLVGRADARIWAAAGSIPLYQRPQLIAARSDLANAGAFGFATPRYQDIGYRKSSPSGD